MTSIQERHSQLSGNLWCSNNMSIIQFDIATAYRQRHTLEPTNRCNILGEMAPWYGRSYTSSGTPTLSGDAQDGDSGRCSRTSVPPSAALTWAQMAGHRHGSLTAGIIGNPGLDTGFCHGDGFTRGISKDCLYNGNSMHLSLH